ncbi:probable cytochrome P450 9f2 [Toxorhynchites rutilus septentrionalis]|uniref:probable cytochrome P450 9f2 n=1 Tax=Toxorhynchites rutilus septentrionalis TaxID=329112 RepID=UPI00247998C8|nr:probable cytochrome P450 9f2 [Toxorhynchites rutilus septentrionalis]
MLDVLTVAAIGAIVLLMYHWVAKKYEYFLTKPVPCVKPTFGFGSNAPLLFRRIDMTTLLTRLYNAYPDCKIMGFYNFTDPIYLLRDPQVIKKIAMKDFDFFMDHSTMTGDSLTEDEVDGESLFENMLFLLRGQKWRDMRATLSPAFTGSKMRHMFGLVAECGQSMVEFLVSEARAGKTLEYEMKDVFSRFGNDVIATVAFGIRMDAFREPENQFYLKSKQVFDIQSIRVVLKLLLLKAMPRLMRKLKLGFIHSSSTDYFKIMIVDNMKQREAHGILRNDMIQMLMEVRKGGIKTDADFGSVEESHFVKSTHSRKWTDNELIAQCLQFFLAGFDTVSTCLIFLTYELAINPDIQKRLYDEVLETNQSLNGNPLTYDALQKMQYMDMVVSEVLRLWPVNAVSDRVCVKDYHYTDDSGTHFVIEKGMLMLIPTIAIHRDPKYYPCPDKFDPERFSEENRSRINIESYMPFGVGPRSCIGSRLALMEVKSIIYYLVKEFRLEPTEKTQIPLRLTKKMSTLAPEGGVWLELNPRHS